MTLPSAVESIPDNSERLAFRNALARVQKIVEDETQALRQQDLSALPLFSRLKDEGLFELTRRARRLEGLDGDALSAQMDALRRALTENQAQLTVHLNAIGAIADAMLRAVTEADSDKTYSSASLAKKQPR